jgi:hypothetical protein
MRKFNKIMISLVMIALTSVLFATVTGASPTLFAGLLFGGGMVLGVAKNVFNLDTTMNTGMLYDGMVISDTTYAGEAASDFIVKAIADNRTVDGGHIYVKDGIKKKYTIPRWDADYEDFIQDVAATPVSKGTQNITGQVLQPSEYMIYHEFDPHDYEDHWFATQIPGSTLLDTQLPTNAESVLVQEVLKRHGRYVNKAIWNSDTTLPANSVYKYYDGLKKKGTASALTNKVGSLVTLTSVNVQGEFKRGFNLIPAALKYDDRMKYFVSFATFELYMQSQIDQTNKGVDVTQRGSDKFRGLTVVAIPDFPDNYYMIAKGSASRDSNIWMGMNSMDDANKIQLAKKQANSRLWFIKLEMKADVQFGWNEEIVTYE